MKHYIILLLMLPFIAIGQSPSQNYIKTKTFKKAYNGTGTINSYDTISSVNYYDGLGRLKQTINVKAGGGGQDVITPFVYDNYGREAKKYLPYANPDQTTSSPNYINNTLLISRLNTYYLQKFPDDINVSNLNPYSETFYEPSPLNRISEQSAPGKSWIGDPLSDTDHTIKFSYLTNNDFEVRKFGVNFIALGNIKTTELTTSKFHDANSLYKTITKNENWIAADGLNNTIEEFTDIEGRLVLKRAYNLGQKHDTYYVYSDLGNLTYVIPPLASDVIMKGGLVPVNTIDQLVVNGLCYIYSYDKRNRVIEKRIPDNGWTHIVYDKLDRPILTQDENQRLANEWMYTKYDVFDRVAITGVYTDNRSRKEIQDFLDGQVINLNVTRVNTPVLSLDNNVPIYYNQGTTFPSNSITPYTYQYYDEYFPPTFTTDTAGYSISLPSTVYGTAIGSAKTLPTISYTRVLEGSNKNWIMNVMAYDNKARVIWNGRINSFLGTNERKEIKLGFTREVIETTTTHTKNGLTNTVYDYYTYDSANRPLKHTQKIGTITALIAQNKYDALGRLEQKKVGGSALATAPGLQTVDFTYNIRGWLKTINNPLSLGSDLFAFGIKYDNNETYSLYNGNISQTSWITLTDNVTRSYNYQYDDLNRLKNASFTVPGPTIKYNESGITYDKNGNILSLMRSGLKTDNTNGVIDNLSYVYTPNTNQLLKVTDSANDAKGFKDVSSGNYDYTYDVSGNMKRDLNKGIGMPLLNGVYYNHLNLPTKVVFLLNSKYIEYVYSATGEKLQKTVNNSGTITTTQYANGYVYQNNVLQYIPNPEGYARLEADGTFRYIYQYKDHLGNVRLSYADINRNGVVVASEIIEEDNYYPFGMKHEGYNTTSLSTNLGQKIKYNGKELQDELGIGWYDYQARNYDPAIGRWFNIDPLAEVSRRWSPYTYALNNPVYFIDPDGMLANPPDWYLDDRTGKLLGQDGAETNNIRLIDSRDFNDIKEANGGSTISAEATAQLQSSDMSRMVTVNDAQIQQELQAVNDLSRTSEHQTNIVLDRVTGEVRAQRGTPGGDGGAKLENVPQQLDGVSYSTVGGNLFLANAHGHNKINWVGKINGAGTSPTDKTSAAAEGVSIYAVEAYNTPVGGQADVSRVTPTGVESVHMAKTKGSVNGAGTVNIGMEELKRWSGLP